MRLTVFRKILSLTMALLMIGAVVLPGCSGSQKVTISKLVVSPEVGAVNEAVTISANILSSEQEDVFYSAELMVNGEKIESKETKVGPGETKLVSFSYTPAATGTYTVDINGQTSSFDVENPAKFEPGTLSVSSESPVTGDEVTFSLTVKNTGGLAGTYTTGLTVDGNKVTDKSVKIEPGSQESVTAAYTFETGGSHTVKFGEDTKDVTVLKAASFEATSVSVSPLSVYTWESVSVKAKITNTGDVEGTIPVDLMLNGTKKSTKEVTVPGNSSEDVTFSVSKDTVGRGTVEVMGKSAYFTVKDLEEYSSDQYFYTISYPPDLALDDSDAAAVIFSGPGDSDGYFAIIVDVVPVEQTAQEYYDFVVGFNQDYYPDWTPTNITEIKEGDTVTGYSFNYTHTIDGVKWQGTAKTIKKGGIGYDIDFSSLQSSWNKLTTVAKKCLDSFSGPVVTTGTYSNPEKGFSVTLPAQWSATDTGDAVTPVVFNSGYDMPGVSAQLSIQDAGTYSVLDYIDYFQSMLESSGFSALTKNKLSMPTGYEGYICSGVMTVGPTDIKTQIACVISDNILYVFTFTGMKEDMDLASSQITKMAGSLQTFTPSLGGYDRNETLVLRAGEIPDLDPALSDSTPGGYMGALFSGLVKLDKNMTPVGDLAESWTVSNDGTTYTFKLRSGATFHDGTPVTADDFKYSWERACLPATKSPNAKKFLNDIVGAQDMFEGKATSLSGVTVIDDTTLQVKIDSPKQYFLDKLTQCVAFVVDETNVRQGSTWYENPNGTGPFKLAEWEQDEKLVLTRNDSYYQTPAKLKNIYYKLYAGLPINLYERGEIDIAGIYGDDIDRVTDTTDPLNKELISEDDTSIIYVVLNNSMAPFDDPLVRKAFAMAIDVDKLIEVIYNGRAEKAAGYLTPSVPGFNSSLQPIPYDVDGALQLISESSYGSVENLPEITFTVPFGLDAESEAIIGMWQQNLGITVKVNAISTVDSYLDKVRARELQAFQTGWGMDYPDPQNFLEVLFYSTSPENSMDYVNPAVDEALIAAGIEPDQTARLQQYREIEKLILADLPAIPLYYGIKTYELVKPYVKGYALYPIDINIWTEITLDPH